MDKKQVTVILPCCDSMPFLKDAIYSLLSSTKVKFNLFLIESESTDGTAEYCDEMAKKEDVYVFHTKKNGLTAAINHGIKNCEGDVYLTQDDVIHFRLYGRDWLYEFGEYCKDTSVGMMTSLFGGGTSGPMYIDGFNWIGTWSCYIPRSTIDVVGVFDENMGPGDDIDYSYRVKKLGLRMGVNPFWVQHHRLTEHPDVDGEKKQKEMSVYFKKKWCLK